MGEGEGEEGEEGEDENPAGGGDDTGWRVSTKMEPLLPLAMRMPWFRYVVSIHPVGLLCAAGAAAGGGESKRVKVLEERKGSHVRLRPKARRVSRGEAGGHTA